MTEPAERNLSPEELAEKFSGTMPVSDRYQTDLHALEQWMLAHVPGFEGPLSIEQFKGGQSNPTFALSTPKAGYVMRSKPGPVAKLLPSAHAIEREYRVLHALTETDVPVPRVFGLCEDESVLGRAFYIMDRVEGRVLWDQGLAGMNQAQRRAIYLAMNHTIATLHQVDPIAVGLGDFGKAGNYFARQISRWSKQYLISETEPIEAMHKLIEWLPAHIPADEQSCIVHGDFRLDNMIFAPDRPQVRAVLDWELSTLGHPLADFSYHCMSWHIPPGTFRGIAGLDHLALGIPLESEYIQLYCEKTGMMMSEVHKHWTFCLAYNMFRLAGILQGIMKRVVDGTAASAEAKESGARARPMAELAWQFAQNH
ncbi:MAG: phosphotransferase family protein [Betaproteobacteria bacterium]|nr:phosphotransferase family protein [Betaproteobacteria bacterium]